MSEFDELQRLRDADPITRASIPSADDPGPRALRERIMMGGTANTWLRSRAAMLSAASLAAVLIASGGIVLATRGTSAPEPPPGPVTPGGMAMCVALYDLGTLKDRELAFAGTVVSVNGDEVSFQVDEWFKGGSGAEISLEGAQTIGGLTSAGDGVSLEPGSHLLVAGDGGFAWSCGFTQPFDPAVADDWRSTLG